MTIGDPSDPQTFLGPLVSRSDSEARVAGYIESGIAEARCWRPAASACRTAWSKARFRPLAVFARVDNGMRIAREEMFGPVSVRDPLSRHR